LRWLCGRLPRTPPRASPYWSGAREANDRCLLAYYALREKCADRERSLGSLSHGGWRLAGPIEPRPRRPLRARFAGTHAVGEPLRSRRALVIGPDWWEISTRGTVPTGGGSR